MIFFIDLNDNYFTFFPHDLLSALFVMPPLLKTSYGIIKNDVYLKP